MTSALSSSTRFTTFTTTPSLANANNGGSSGLSSKSKSIIGGVVGGIGGFVLLGGIALVCWRIWGRKRQQDDDLDFITGTGQGLGSSGSAEKRETDVGRIADDSAHNDRYTSQVKPNAAQNF
jgi:hypothetical protein